jgi:hypothetical protein
MKVVVSTGSAVSSERKSQMRSADTLRLFVPAVLLLIAVEAVVSIAAGWPHQFNGSGDPHRVLAEFPASGTALAPPVFVIVVLALVAAGLQRSGAVRTVATALVVPLAVVMAVGSAGEALAPATPDVPRSVQLVGGGLDALLSVVLLVLAVLALVEGRRARGGSEVSAVATKR